MPTTHALYISIVYICTSNVLNAVFLFFTFVNELGNVYESREAKNELKYRGGCQTSRDNKTLKESRLGPTLLV